MWTPDLREHTAPRYVAIADALGADVEAGRLLAGDRLPTHRDLAKRLGVTVGTVSRAYAEAERRGLVRGEVGRGTFVSEALALDPSPEPPRGFGEPLRHEDGVLDLGPSVPASPFSAEEEGILREAFGALSLAPHFPALLECQPHAGAWRHREAGARWLGELGFVVPAERLLVTSGAQHAMAVTFATLAQPGDTVLTEAVTFPGMKGLASLMHLRLRGIEMDAEGLLPEAFERACRQGESKVLYTIPTLQNPTGAVMGESRRQEIAEIALRYGISIVEDDIYGFLVPERPSSFTLLAPELTYSIHTASKIVAPGLRVGYLIAPEGQVERLGAGIWATTWMACPPMVEILSRWIEDRTIERFLVWRREEAKERCRLAQRVLERHVSGPLRGFFLWLTLPDPWCASDFVRLAKRRGVLICGPEAFVAGRGSAPHAVRVSLASVRNRQRLEDGLKTLAEILDGPPAPLVSIA